jgi:hypothetical protein
MLRSARIAWSSLTQWWRSARIAVDQLWGQEGFRMQGCRRYWSSVAWSLWIVVFGVSAAVVCASHPATHVEPHPPLCIDSITPMTHRDDKPILFADGGMFPLPRKFSDSLVPLPAMSIHPPLALGLLTHELFQTQARVLPIIPRGFLPVLQL